MWSFVIINVRSYQSSLVILFLHPCSWLIELPYHSMKGDLKIIFLYLLLFIFNSFPCSFPFPLFWCHCCYCIVVDYGLPSYRHLVVETVHLVVVVDWGHTSDSIYTLLHDAHWSFHSFMVLAQFSKGAQIMVLLLIGLLTHLLVKFCGYGLAS